MIVGIVMAAVLVTMALALLRALLGPSIFDRILAINMFGTKTVLLVAVVTFVIGRPEFIDLALLYGFLNFIGVIAVLRMFRFPILRAKAGGRAMITDVLAAVFVLTGAFFSLVGGLGILRLPDFYSRMHGAALTDTLGAWLILLGLMFIAGFTLVTVKLILLGLLLSVTSPTATHALANAAWHHGLRPWRVGKDEDVSDQR